MALVTNIISLWRKRIYVRLGIPMRLQTHARKILEDKILPYYSGRKDINRVLFVGCDPYTAHYEKLFRTQEYWTIDPDPKKKAFGSKKHVVDKLENLLHHFKPRYFDLIICNGVYGWGLNTKEQCEEGFTACLEGLRLGGEFILGWNEIKKHRPVSLMEIESIRKFRQKPFPPLDHAVYLPPVGCHVYAFFDRSDDVQ